MEALEFKLQGKMAHFRKYYSNSTALSYHVPPVITVKGILAGLLGRERDSYYEEFSNEQCCIGIAIDFPLKKITQTMNLLKVERVSELSGTGVHSQNNTEWVVPQNIRTGILSYTIVVVHKKQEIMDALLQKTGSLDVGYQSEGISLALGAAQCQGWITGGKKIELSWEKSGSEEVISRFAVPVSVMDSVKMYQNSFSIKKEETITELDRDRYLTEGSKMDIMLSANGLPLSYQLKPGTLYWKYGQENLVLLGDHFME